LIYLDVDTIVSIVTKATFCFD